jgi:hypothetical protein
VASIDLAKYFCHLELHGSVGKSEISTTEIRFVLLLKHHTMEIHEKTEPKYHTFISSALNRVGYNFVHYCSDSRQYRD